MQLYAIRRRSAWTDAEELKAAGEASRAVGQQMADRLRWIRSYVLAEPDGRLGSVCIYEAADDKAIRDHAAAHGARCDEISPVADTAIVRPDPQAAR